MNLSSLAGWLKARYGSSAGQIADVRMDSATDSLQTLDYAHHEVHAGSSFAAHLYELTFAKNGEMGIIFTTPDTTKWSHMLALLGVADKSTFEILEGPTIDTGNYPTNFYAPINRDRNSNTQSVLSSVRASPVANQVSLVLDGDNSPVSADGTVIHGEVIGGAKNKAAGEGVRSVTEYILKRNTTYYYRIVGDNTGSGALGLSMELVWYEHTNRR